MANKVKVRLSGAAGTRIESITPKGFPTRHIRTGKPAEMPPLAITPNPKPVLPAYNKAWNDNCQRVIDFLSYGFQGNISEGIVLFELGEAITKQYTPRKKMTPDQWRDLTADLQLSTWGYSHWIKALRTHIWRKFEDRRYLNLKGSIVRVVREIHAPAEMEYPERVLFEGKMAGDFEEKWQAYCDVHDVNIAIYTDSSGKNKRYIMPSWTKEWKPAGCTRCGSPTCAGVGSTGIRCSRRVLA